MSGTDHSERVGMVWIIITIGITLIIAATVATMIAARRADRHFFGKRYNGNPFVHYFEAKDFPGLQAQPISFPSSSGITLRGYLYHAKGVQVRALTVFVHGLGAGHLAYTTEINFLANSGYLVLAFDMTGCGASEGNALLGFDQGPLDVSAALRFIDSQPRLAQFPVFLIGHSWGAYSVINALPNYPGIAGAIAVCGFISGASSVAQSFFSNFGFLSPLLSGWLWLFNRKRFGRNANQNALSALQKTDCPLLLLYGGEDKIVRYRENGARIRKAAEKQDNIKFLYFPHKGHNVYLSDRAEKALQTQLGNIPKTIRKDKLALQKYYASLDYKLLTEEDMSVMSEITKFLDSCLEGFFAK